MKKLLFIVAAFGALAVGSAAYAGEGCPNSQLGGQFDGDSSDESFDSEDEGQFDAEDDGQLGRLTGGVFGKKTGPLSNDLPGGKSKTKAKFASDSDDKLEELKSSSWKTKYNGTDLDGFVKADIEFDGEDATWQARDINGNSASGTFTGVKYRNKRGVVTIRGDYQTLSGGDETGEFEFELDEDLESFDGTWENDAGTREGSWKGKID